MNPALLSVVSWITNPRGMSQQEIDEDNKQFLSQMKKDNQRRAKNSEKILKTKGRTFNIFRCLRKTVSRAYWDIIARIYR